MKVGPLGQPVDVSITSLAVSALENCYVYSFLEVPADILNHFWVKAAVLEAKWPVA
jgi:hypothetical protein